MSLVGALNQRGTGPILLDLDVFLELLEIPIVIKAHYFRVVQ